MRRRYHDVVTEWLASDAVAYVVAAVAVIIVAARIVKAGH